jgi:hypothetical protein
MPKSKHQIPGRVRSAYEFINAHRDQYSVQMMCRVLEVALVIASPLFRMTPLDAAADRTAWPGGDTARAGLYGDVCGGTLPSMQ